MTTATEARNRCIELASAGYKPRAIARQMRKEGYVSKATGRPLAATTVGFYVWKHRAENRAKANKLVTTTNFRVTETTDKSTGTTKRAAYTKWDIAKMIDESSDFTPETRQNLIRQIVL